MNQPEVTDDPQKGRHFPDAVEAFQCWQQQKGLRPDGKPNRPLTSYHCEFLTLEQAISEEVDNLFGDSPPEGRLS